MEDTLKITRAMISPQTQYHLYGFDEKETSSPGTISLPVRADPYSIITEFYVVDVASIHNAILRRPWLHIMKDVPSTYHRVWNPTPSGMADIRGDHTMSRTISVVARKKLGWRSITTKAVSEEKLPERKKHKLIAT